MLVTLTETLRYAEEHHCAVGAFNTPNLESIIAVIGAAEELNVPVILMHCEPHEELVSIDVIGPIMLHFARNAKVPVCVHCDHGTSFELVMRALQLGFSSVMYDASTKPYEINVSETAEVTRVAHAFGASVEAELGRMTKETASPQDAVQDDQLAAADRSDLYTDPAQAYDFVTRTGVDALAVSFGTAHGLYTRTPVLDVDRVAQISAKISTPLVMHGGSGVSDEDFIRVIQNGVRKINYFTYMSKAGGKSVVEHLHNRMNDENVFAHEIAAWSIEGMKENVKQALEVFTVRDASAD